MTKQTAAKARLDLLKLANEKCPSSLSEVKLFDLKQARAALAAARHLSSNDQDSPDSDLADFLTNLGATIFAQANSRVLTTNVSSLGGISDHATPLPVHKTVHRLHSHPNFCPEISVPSHVVFKSQGQTVARQLNRRNNNIVQAALINLKKETVKKMREEARITAKNRVLARLHGIGSLSIHLKRERDFLRKALLARRSLEDRMSAVKAKINIVVVGAGMAGISAADQLLSFGFSNVLVLDAMDRIGGRIHSVPFSNSSVYPLEMGVSCVDHANNDNYVYSLIKLLGLPVEKYPEDTTQHVILPDKEMPLKAEVVSYISMFCQLLPTDSHILYSLIKSHHCGNVRLAYKDYINERCRRVVRNNNFQTVSRSTAGICQMANRLHICTKYKLGDSEGDLAIQLLGFHQDYGGTKIALPMGMSSLLTPLTARLKSDKLKLRAYVKLVKWRASHRKDQLNCQITCSDGRLFTAHHVIIAVPLGHLKENASAMFMPALPAHKFDAIMRMGFGTVTKVYLCYKDKFWSKPFSFIWPGTVTDDENILSQTFRIATLDCDPKTLEVIVLGDTSERITDVSPPLTAILRLYFHTDIPQPEEVRKSQWYSNFLFRGTHPFLSTQSLENDVSVLGEPLMCGDQPVVLFAGDYTHNNYSCLIHAARASGLREAQRIQDLYNTIHGSENANY